MFGYEEYLQKKKEKKVLEQVNHKEKISNKDIKNNEKNTKKLENEIIKLEGKVKQLNQELLKKEIYMDNIKSKKISKQIEELQEQIEIKTKEWMEIN